ncbi:MAG: single-stranded DNA-binding protein [Holosporales bacterium]|jgi:single-strand DNA-binding protein|nr:single-stranded DNA-binding protein [Holosporales bacterium]
MAGFLNKVMLIGNLGKDPEIKFMPDGSKIANFTMATSEYWKDKLSGERKEKTEWHRVAVYNDRLVDFVEKYVRKGTRLYIEGQLQTRRWTDQAGVEKYTTEVFLSKFKGEIAIMDSKRTDFDQASVDEHSKEATDVELNDDIPF